MRRPSKSATFISRHRVGFTLLELLVAISIISVLMSLILPAIQQARSAARRIECQNNIRNLTVGTLNYASIGEGYLPSVISPRDGIHASWVTEILPHIDARSLYDSLDVTNPPDVRLKVLVCPDDEKNQKFNRGLSYVVNVGYGLMTPQCHYPPIHMDEIIVAGPDLNIASILSSPAADLDGYDGYEISTVFSLTERSTGSPANPRMYGLDWNRDGTISQEEDLITSGTGVFWSYVHRRNTTFPIRRIETGDGTSNTFLLSERAAARDWVGSRPRVNDECLRLRFMAPLAAYGFGIATAAFRAPDAQHRMPTYGIGWIVSERTPLDFELLDIDEARLECPCLSPHPPRIINRPTVLQAPPTSGHVGGVSMSFCDGAVKFMSDDLDRIVYCKLISSDASQYGQDILSENDF